MNPEADLRAFCERPQRHEHSVVFFEKPLDKYRILFEFLRNGLDAGGSGVYVTLSEAESRILRLMRRFGIDTQRYLQNGRLAIHRKKLSYTGRTDGKTEPTRLADLKSVLSGISGRKGGQIVRVASSLSERLQHRGRVSDVARLERVIDSIVHEQELAVMCAYDSRIINKAAWFRVFPYLTSIHAKGAFISQHGSLVMDKLKGNGQTSRERGDFEGLRPDSSQISSSDASNRLASNLRRGREHESPWH